MAGLDNFLVVEPRAELKFRFELRKNVPCTVELWNPGQQRVAFKVKTTDVKKYCVRPSSGIVEPGSCNEVQVIMQAQREYPPSLADCNDKFLVQCVKLGASNAKEVSPDMFDASKQKDIRQTKLRVVLVGPPEPPSPVCEGEEEEEPAASTYLGQPSRAVAALFDMGTAEQEHKTDIYARLEMLEEQARQDELDASKLALQALQAEAEELRASNSELGHALYDSLRAHEDQVADVKDQLADVKGQLTEAQSERDKLREQLAKATSDLDAQLSAAGQQQQQVTALQQSLLEARAAAAAQEALAGQHSRQALALQARCEDLAAQVHGLQLAAQVHRLQEELTEAKQRAAAAEDLLSKSGRSGGSQQPPACGRNSRRKAHQAAAPATPPAHTGPSFA